MKTGIELITKERKRQIEKEGWTAEHDDDHRGGELALAAALYATPIKLYGKLDLARGVLFQDQFPWSDWDKRFSYGERKNNPGNVVPEPSTYTSIERKDLLIKAGALIAAEIDRLQRQNEELKVGDKIDIGGFITELKEIKFDKMANIFLYWFYNEAGEYKYNVREFMFKVVEDNNK